MKSLAIAAVVLAACVLLAGSAGAELLVNGGAETGTMASWSVSDASVIGALTVGTQQSGSVYPHSGDFLFSFELHSGTHEEMWQTGTAGLGAATLTLAGVVSTEDMPADDYGVAKLTFFDAASQPLDSAQTSPLTSASTGWEPFEVSLDVPAGATSWEVRLSGTRLYGSYINVFYDDVSLTPEPATMGLLALGAMGLIRRRRE